MNNFVTIAAIYKLQFSKLNFRKMKKISLLCFVSFVLLSCSTQHEKTGEVSFVKLMQTTKSWNGSELPEYPDGQPEISILKVIIPPQAKLSLHKHSLINAGILLAGELTVITEKNDTLHMKAGDTISEVVDIWHHGINPGKDTVEIVVFYAGAVGTPLSIHADSEK